MPEAAQQQSQEQTKEFQIKNVRLAFPEIWNPVEFKPGDGNPRYSAVFLIEKGSPTDQFIQQKIKEKLKESFGAKAEVFWERVKHDTQKNAYIDGDDKEKYDGFAGMMALSCHRKEADGAPTLCDRDRTPLTKGSGKPYAGCYVNAFVSIYIQGPNSENPGVRASFGGIQFFKKGDAFSGGAPVSANAFDDLGEDDDDVVDMGKGGNDASSML